MMMVLKNKRVFGNMTSSRDDSAPIVSDSKLQWLQHERQSLLEAFLHESPLCTIPSTPIPWDRSEGKLPRKLVAQYLEGQRAPLTQLASSLEAALYQEDGHESTDLKFVICDFAERKFYGPKEGKEEVDLAPFEDVSRGPFWFWQLRSLANLPEKLKSSALKARKKHKQMQDRLQALSAVLRLSDSSDQSEGMKRISEVPKKIQKVIEKLDRVPDLQSINERFSQDTEEESVQKVGKRVKREAGVENTPSLKTEMKRQEKLAVASGFGSHKNLEKKQKNLKSFFSTPQKENQHKIQHLEEFTMAGRVVLSCPENKRLRFALGNVNAMDALLSTEVHSQDLQTELLSYCQGLKACRSTKKLVYGAPPPWARRPGYTMDFEAECEKLFGAEYNSVNICAIRKKYLWFSSDSDCPPYFGPFERVEGPTGRNPFIQAASLDYDELFDEGWEEDPDGESLSVEDDEEEEKLILSDEDDAFVVEDGYLSEDEGIGGEMDVDETCSNSSTSAADVTVLPQSGEGLGVSGMESIVRSSLKSGQSVLFTGLNVTMPPKKHWTCGDATMLELLRVIPFSGEKISLKNK